MHSPTPKRLSTKPLYERTAVIEAVRLIVGDGNVTELRALEATTASDRRPHTLSGYFDDAEKLADALATIKSANGIYFVPNPVDGALLARAMNRLRATPKGESTADVNITRRHWLLVDVDAQRVSGVSASDAEHEAAIQRAREVYVYLKSLGWPEPIAANSGNGGHLLYRVDLPTNDEGLVQRCLQALARRFDDGFVKIDATVHNPARIWKLYGSLCCKGDDTADRPHRLSRMLTRPDELCAVPIEMLETLAAETKAETKSARAPAINGSTAAAFDLNAFIARHNLDVDGPRTWNGDQGVGQAWTFNTSPMCDHHADGAFMIQHASGAITAGCHHNSCDWTWGDLRQAMKPGNTAAQSSGELDAIAPIAITVNLADVQPKPIQWLWANRMAVGKLTVFSGDPGLGKSFLTLDLAARVTRGQCWPDDAAHSAPQGSVVLLSAEDDLADTIRPRLDAAGADVSKIVAIQSVRGKDLVGHYDRLFDLSRDVQKLEDAIQKLSDCKLVVIDPISAYLGKTRSHDNAEVRSVLAPLSEMAGRMGVAIIAVSHLRKGEGPALYRTMGSMAFVAAARAAFAVTKDKDDITGKRRLWLPLKNNIGNEETGMAFQLSSRLSWNGQPRVVWEAEPVCIKADDALSPPTKERGRKPDERAEATEFLQVALANGPRPAKEVTEEAIQGKGISKRTLDRARSQAGVVAYRESPTGPWHWKLPVGHIANSNHGAPLRQTIWHSGNVDKNTGESELFEVEESQIAKLPLRGNLVNKPGKRDEWGTV